MKLLGTLTSPYTRKARIVLAEKKIDYEWIVASPDDADSGVTRYNPLGRIPVLVLDDDSAIFDSPVIVEYLDNLSPNNKLFPQPARERIDVKRWEALADGIMDAAVAVRLETQRPNSERSQRWIGLQQQAVANGVEAMSRQLGESAWCMGTPFTFADVAVGAALGYLAFRFPELDWRERHANLARLFDKLKLRPSFTDTAPRD